MKGINRYRIDKIRAKKVKVNPFAYQVKAWNDFMENATIGDWDITSEPVTVVKKPFNGSIQNEPEQDNEIRKALYIPLNSLPHPQKWDFKE